MEGNMAEHEPVRYQAQNGNATIRLDRPEALNALNKESLHQPASILDKAKADDAVKAVSTFCCSFI
jgi:enoyl-CoA hydratase/carnithine racemase